LFDTWYTAAIVTLATVFLVLEWLKPHYVLWIALIALYLGGVLSLDEAFAGFSNQGMLTVAVLYIIAATLQSSVGFTWLVDRIMGKKPGKNIYFRLMIPVSFLSAFLNNTPVVATLIPILRRWSKKYSFPASKLMIPLSYAAILGGMCTLIGTSTNLVVHGLLLEEGREGFGFFELGKAGLPVALVVILYFTLIGHRLLPNRKDTINQLSETSREFVVEVKVGDSYPHTGKSIEQANLRHLRGLYLFQIIRNGNEMAPLSPDEVIHTGDRLFFTGIPETIYDLIKTPGLHLIKDREYNIRNMDSDKHKTFEAVLSNNSPLIGNTVRDSGFRTKYNAVILAIHRNGSRINQKVGDIEFHANDTLFLLADKKFEDRWYHSPEFSLVSRSISEYSKPRIKGNLALIMVAAMVLVVSMGIIESMLVAAMITAAVFMLLRIISFHDAKNAIDMQVLLVIVAALGIGRAISASGLADLVAGTLITKLAPFGIIGIIAGIFLITSFYTEIITNNAAAAILFPFVLATANELSVDPRPLIITLALAASSSFATPIGYQTNMMVYSPGGYKFTDFLKTGLIINLLAGLVITITVYLLFFI